MCIQISEVTPRSSTFEITNVSDSFPKSDITASSKVLKNSTAYPGTDEQILYPVSIDIALVSDAVSMFPISDIEDVVMSTSSFEIGLPSNFSASIFDSFSGRYNNMPMRISPSHLTYTADMTFISSRLDMNRSRFMIGVSWVFLRKCATGSFSMELNDGIVL